MLTEINDKLVKIQGELRKKAKYQGQLDDYERELAMVEETLLELESQLADEQKDVEKLESFSLANLIATLSGKKEEKLTKEKQELVAAQYKVEEAAKTRKDLDQAIVDLQGKLLTLENLEKGYQLLPEQKERRILLSSLPSAARMFELSEQEGRIQAYVTELDEAILSGERLKRALMNARNSLESAANWGKLDLLGGGTLSGLAKHRHIDDAESSIRRAQQQMRLFQKELLDVQEQAQLQIDISGMLKFADFFFDGFIADYIVQGKINRSLEDTKNHLGKVNGILLKLKEQAESSELEIERIQREKREIVESV